MNKFLKINEIDVNNYDNNIFITFDIDWCSDEVLLYTLELVNEYKIKSTFFATHETKILNLMRSNDNIELGIHPNFDLLLNGDFTYGNNIKEVLAYYKGIVPEAISIRSHSLTYSGKFISLYDDMVFDCNCFIPYTSNIDVKPWKDINNRVFRVPHFFADDGLLYENIDMSKLVNLVRKNGLKVFDFHPIHIFLNSDNIERYNNARPYFQDYKKLQKCVNTTSYGVRDLFIDLIKYGKIK